MVLYIYIVCVLKKANTNTSIFGKRLVSWCFERMRTSIGPHHCVCCVWEQFRKIENTHLLAFSAGRPEAGRLWTCRYHSLLALELTLLRPRMETPHDVGLYFPRKRLSENFPLVTSTTETEKVRNFFANKNTHAPMIFYF
jgi:hypothetical protein